MSAVGEGPLMTTGPLSARRRARSWGGLLALLVLACVATACIASLPWTLGRAAGASAPRYRAENLSAHRLPPSWWPHKPDERARRDSFERDRSAAGAAPFPLGTDALGRDVLARCLLGGCVSLGVGLAAALVGLCIGVGYGMAAGYAGGRIDAILMRVVDVLYGLPYVLLVVLLAVAVDALAESRMKQSLRSAQEERIVLRDALLRDGPEEARGEPEAIGAAEAAAARAIPLPDAGIGAVVRIGTLIVAIGGVSWLTIARIARGQTLSLRARPFVDAARAAGASPLRILRSHILPNLAAPVIVYATLAVPQAILQESFLSFLGIGVPAPAPSWGNLVADGLTELNVVRSRWWLLLFPCLLLAATLLSLNGAGDALRERLDPRRER